MTCKRTKKDTSINKHGLPGIAIDKADREADSNQVTSSEVKARVRTQNNNRGTALTDISETDK